LFKKDETRRMSDDLLLKLNDAKKLEESGKCAKATEAAFNRFIVSYQDQPAQVRTQFRQHLSFAYNSRGLARYLQVEFELALDDFSEAIALDSSVANFYYNRGLIKFRLKDFGLARVDLEKALALDPRHESAVKCLDTMEKMIER